MTSASLLPKTLIMRDPRMGSFDSRIYRIGLAVFKASCSVGLGASNPKNVSRFEFLNQDAVNLSIIHINMLA